MEMEDSRNALFCDPNAYIQRFEKRDNSQPRKVVFQEPYEQLPNFYINNNFKKGDCDCIPKHGHNNQQHNHDCNSNHRNNNEQNNSKQGGFGFDLKSLMPMLNMFNKGGGMNFGQIANLLNSNKSGENSSNPLSMISSLLSNSGGLSNILNLFKGGLFNKTQHAKKELKTTDFEIKNYTRVE